MLVKIEEDDIQTRKADERGRVNLGSDYGGKEIEVAVLEVVDDGNPGCDVCGSESTKVTPGGHVYCDECFNEVEDKDD